MSYLDFFFAAFFLAAAGLLDPVVVFFAAAVFFLGVAIESKTPIESLLELVYNTFGWCSTIPTEKVWI